MADSLVRMTRNGEVYERFRFSIVTHIRTGLREFTRGDDPIDAVEEAVKKLEPLIKKYDANVLKWEEHERNLKNAKCCKCGKAKKWEEKNKIKRPVNRQV